MLSLTNSNNLDEVYVSLNDLAMTQGDNLRIDLLDEVVVGLDEQATTNTYIQDPYNTDNFLSIVDYAINTNNTEVHRIIFNTEMKKLELPDGGEEEVDLTYRGLSIFYYNIDLYINLLIEKGLYDVLENSISGFTQSIDLTNVNLLKCSHYTNILFNALDNNNSVDGSFILDLIDSDFLAAVIAGLYKSNHIDSCKFILDTLLTRAYPMVKNKLIELLKKRIDISTLLSENKKSVPFSPFEDFTARFYNEYNLLENSHTWMQYWDSLNNIIDFKTPLSVEIIEYIKDNINYYYFIDIDTDSDTDYCITTVEMNEKYSSFKSTFGMLFAHPVFRNICVENKEKLKKENFANYQRRYNFNDECDKFVYYFTKAEEYERVYTRSNNIKMEKIDICDDMKYYINSFLF
jgi:hypothetical protein